MCIRDSRQSLGPDEEHVDVAVGVCGASSEGPEQAGVSGQNLPSGHLIANPIHDVLSHPRQRLDVGGSYVRPVQAIERIAGRSFNHNDALPDEACQHLADPFVCLLYTSRCV